MTSSDTMVRRLAKGRKGPSVSAGCCCRSFRCNFAMDSLSLVLLEGYVGATEMLKEERERRFTMEHTKKGARIRRNAFGAG